MGSNLYFVFLYLLFIVFFIIKIYSNRKIFILSPVDIFIGFYIAVILITTLYHYYYPNSQKFDLYNFDSLNRKNYLKQVAVFLRMLTLYLFGVFIYRRFNNDYRIISSQSIKIVDSGKININFSLVYNVTIIILFICLFLVYLDYGSQLVIRKKYIPKDNSIYKTIYTILLISLSVLSAVLIRRYRTLSVITITLVVLIGIGLGSRMATIDLIVFLVTFSIFIKEKRNVFIYYLIVIPFILLFFGYNISLRLESSGHGLIPYLSITINKPNIIFKYALLNIYYTFTYGFYATSETIKFYSENIHKLITCISPLPGALTDWYSMANKMRLNVYAPYTAIGELAKFPVFSFFYYIFLGFYFSHADKFVKQSIINKKYLIPILLVLLLSLSIMQSYEYNLRSTNRFIYYSAFLLLLAELLKKIKPIKIVWK